MHRNSLSARHVGDRLHLFGVLQRLEGALFAFLLVVVILVLGGPAERMFHRHMSQNNPSVKDEADSLNK
jgi:hypothetical protein